MKRYWTTLILMWLSVTVHAVEITVQNDSLMAGDNSTIQSGFVAGEIGAAWLTSPCDGTIVALQVFWRSLSGTFPPQFERSIRVYSDAGTFPTPGVELSGGTLIAPLMNDGVINEFRFVDDDQVIPIDVPVVEDQVFVVAFEFDLNPSPTGPSLNTDDSGCQVGRNSLFAIPGGWLDSCLLGVSGDFIIRAVVDCPAGPDEADLSISQSAMPASFTPGQNLTFTITAANAGPVNANAVTVIDNFSSDLSGVTWTCMALGGASCGAGIMGSGNIITSVNLPVGGSVIYTATGTVDMGAADPVSNTAQVVVPAGLTDPDTSNNMSTLDVPMAGDLIFEDSFE